jgi:hypothetical protein
MTKKSFVGLLVYFFSFLHYIHTIIHSFESRGLPYEQASTLPVELQRTLFENKGEIVGGVEDQEITLRQC